MKSDLAYIKLVLTVIAVAAVYGAVTTSLVNGPAAVTAGVTPASSQPAGGSQGGIPDAGKQAYDTIQALETVNGSLKGISDKMDVLIDLLKSGKVEVVAKTKGKDDANEK